MGQIPTLATARLILRPFRAEDAPSVRELAGDRAIAETTSSFPHPYEEKMAEIGYWIGKPYWSQGYCTEAAREVVRYGFEVLNLNRIQARHMTKNPASGRVMEKVGMKYEGRLRQSLLRWDQFEDVAIYSILRDESSDASGRPTEGPIGASARH